MNKYYTAHGIVRYKNDWIILECPPSIVNYYKWWIEKFVWKKISTPLYGAHVTVLAGKHEKGLSKHPLWNKHQGQRVEFKYESKIYTDHEWFFKGKYFWLRVECPLLNQIRLELGLRPEPYHPLHLTIGVLGY